VIGQEQTVGAMVYIVNNLARHWVSMEVDMYAPGDTFSMTC
jgi:hypothetical protein